MFPEARLKEELSFTCTDIERAVKVFDILKLTVPGGQHNPHWTMALQDLANARQRIANIQSALAAPEITAVDLPAAAPPPAPLV